MKQLKRRLLSKKKTCSESSEYWWKNLWQKLRRSSLVFGIKVKFFGNDTWLNSNIFSQIPPTPNPFKLFQNLEVKFLGLPLFSKRLPFCDFIIPAKFTGQFILMRTFHFFISLISFRKQGRKVCLNFFEPNVIFYSTWAQIHHANSFNLQGEEGQPQ